MWAIGVIAYQVLSGKLPFEAKTDNELLDLIARCKLDLDGECRSLIS